MALNLVGSEWTSSSIGNITALSNGTLLSLRTDAEGTMLTGQILNPDGSVVGGSFTIRAVAAGSMFSASAAALDNGRFAVVWTHNSDGLGAFKVETRLFKADGTAEGNAEEIGSGASSPQIASLSDGGYVVTYYEGQHKGAVFDPLGNAVRTTDIDPGGSASVAALTGGGYVAVGTTNPTPMTTAIKAVVAVPSGVPNEIMVTGGGSMTDPKVAGLANGNFVVVWLDKATPGNAVKARVYDPQGNAVTQELSLYAKDTDTRESPIVKALPGGGFALAFTYRAAATDAYVGIYSATGDVVSAPAAIGQDTSGSEAVSSLAVLQDGRYVVGWDVLNETRHFQMYDASVAPPPADPPPPPPNLKLVGTTKGDRLVGGAGNDVFYGRFGNDALTGKAGKDTFVFDTKLGTPKTDRKINFDKITDFVVKDDTFFLDNKIFTKLGKGYPAKPYKLNKKFFALDKAKDGNDFLIYNRKSGVLSYDRDGSGKGEAVEFAQLTKGLKLTYLDFMVI